MVAKVKVTDLSDRKKNGSMVVHSSLGNELPFQCAAMRRRGDEKTRYWLFHVREWAKSRIRNWRLNKRGAVRTHLNCFKWEYRLKNCLIATSSDQFIGIYQVLMDLFLPKSYLHAVAIELDPERFGGLDAESNAQSTLDHPKRGAWVRKVLRQALSPNHDQMAKEERENLQVKI